MSAASSDALRTDLDLESAAYRDQDFPGCESFHLSTLKLDCLPSSALHVVNDSSP